MQVCSVVQGRVVEVLAMAGAKVLSGDDLVIVESMKMEVPIQAPGNGTVANVLVAPGDQVEEGTVLVMLE